MGDIETYMNNYTIKQELGVSTDTKFSSCNMNVNQAFFTQGDGSRNSALVIPELLESGIRLLVYAGNAGTSSLLQSVDHRAHPRPSKDFMCNAIGESLILLTGVELR